MFFYEACTASVLDYHFILPGPFDCIENEIPLKEFMYHYLWEPLPIQEGFKDRQQLDWAALGYSTKLVLCGSSGGSK